MRRAGLGEAGEERTFGETLTCTPKKSTALKIERLDLEGHLQGRGHGALPGVSRWRPSYLFGRYSQVFLHCAVPARRRHRASCCHRLAAANR